VPVAPAVFRSSGVTIKPISNVEVKVKIMEDEFEIGKDSASSL
jgi:hypothetical protein